MKRRNFLKEGIALVSLAPLASDAFTMKNLLDLKESDVIMPVLFMGHGNPMNAISDNENTRNWSRITSAIPRPSAIMCISAHWETNGTKVNSLPNPKLIYDMYGFPRELYEVKYNCPGSEKHAGMIRDTVDHTTIMADLDWGLDHGAWSLLVKMYPDATIPCFQLSLNKTRDMKWHYELGRELEFLRRRGVLIIGSGNIVHNLQYARQGMEKPFEWAIEFDSYVKTAVDAGNHNSLINYMAAGKSASLSVNSAEHYIPLLYVLASQGKNDKVEHFNENIDLGSAGMRCIKIG